MYTIDGVILYKDRIVIPVSFREDILNFLHSAHQSVGPMLSQTMSTIFWLGIKVAVQDCGNCCTDCHSNASSQPNAAPYPIQTPEYPISTVP